MIVASTPEECARAAGGPRPFVVTIGNFDGVHLGHQALIRRTVNRAHKLGLRALAVTFEPHPAGVLTDNPPPALSSARQRLDLLASLGMDATLLMPFTLELASVSAEEFCRAVLKEALHTHVLFIGYDFCLGRDQAGPEAISNIGRRLGFEVMHIHAVMFEGSPVSSTRIRRALADGRLDLANAMLGRPHTVRGMVVHGAGRGGPLLGVPTANLEQTGVMLPRPAVYATTARLTDGGKAMPSVTCFSRNPRFWIFPAIYTGGNWKWLLWDDCAKRKSSGGRTSWWRNSMRISRRGGAWESIFPRCRTRPCIERFGLAPNSLNLPKIEHFSLKMLPEPSEARFLSALLIRSALRADG